MTFAEIISTNTEAVEWAGKVVRNLYSTTPCGNHHLEAALRMLDVTCGECEGRGEKVAGVLSDTHWATRSGENAVKVTPCTCTCTNGKVNAYEHFMQRFGG